MLGAATFTGVTTELLPIGLLPAMSADLSASEAALGTAVTGYALVVALSATSLTAVTARWSRRRLLVTVLLAYAASNAVVAAAPSLTVLLAARAFGGLCHGIFWSMVAGYAARLVPRDQVGRATSAVFTGNALAVAVGLPLSTAAGTAFGWRVTFLGVAVLAAAIALLAQTWLPPLPALAAPDGPAGGPAPHPLRAAISHPGVRAVTVATALLVLGLYTFFSYITIYLRDAGAADAAIGGALLAYGTAGVLGTVLLGRAYDRSPRTSSRTVTGTLLGALVVLALLAVLDPEPWVAAASMGATTVLGAAAVALPVLLQATILTHAGPAPDAASSLFVAAFNLGIAGGGLLGGLLLATAGSGLLPAAGVLIAAAGAVALRRGQGPAPNSTPATRAAADRTVTGEHDGGRE